MPHSDVLLLPRVRRRRGARPDAVAALLAVATSAFAADGTQDDGRRPAEEGHDQADPEGARHQGRRRDGPEDPPRAQALPAGATASRPTASPARPRSGRSASPARPGPHARLRRRRRRRRRDRPRQDRPVRVRRRPDRGLRRRPYRGKYQFSQATWEALGGTGDPAEADEARRRTLYAAPSSTQRARLRRRGRPAARSDGPHGRSSARRRPRADRQPRQPAGVVAGALAHRRTGTRSAARRRRAATALAGTSLVTTVLVPMTALSPTVAPRRMHAP